MYYIMDRDQGMAETVAAAMPSPAEIAACRWLRAGGARQIYFKVCSTFDSTPRGNIGPVAEAPPGCVTVNVRPAMAMVPVREAVVVFGSAV